MKRCEKRKIGRRKARRKSRSESEASVSSLKTWYLIYDGNKKKISLQLRAGGIRHQPRRVREMVLGKRKILTRAESEAIDKYCTEILTRVLAAAFGVDLEPKTASIPNSIPDDPLPPHEPDGYWSGYKSHWPFGKDPATEYAEGREAIADMALRHRQSYPFEFKTSKVYRMNSAEEFRNYIEMVYTTELITPEGDNRVRYQLLEMSEGWDSLLGMLCCRCGDCGKIAAGLLHGNPDMGDSAYQIMHRKDWFCCNFGWTFMGGHGYPGGRRMICPECSKVYERKEAKE